MSTKKVIVMTIAVLLTLEILSIAMLALFFPATRMGFVRSENYDQNMIDRVLAAKSQEPGVKPIDKGIFYKPIAHAKPGAPSPNSNSVVTVHYTGRTINGKKFDSSRGGTPLAMRLRDLIQGWIIALQQMHVGDRWEVYIPAEMGYGKLSQPGIPGGSTLIFDIELLGVN